MRTADTLLTASQRWRLAPHSPLTGLAQPQVCCGSLPGSHVHTTLTPRAGDWTSSSSCHVLGINSQYGVTTFHSFKSFPSNNSYLLQNQDTKISNNLLLTLCNYFNKNIYFWHIFSLHYQNNIPRKCEIKTLQMAC